MKKLLYIFTASLLVSCTDNLAIPNLAIHPYCSWNTSYDYSFYTDLYYNNDCCYLELDGVDWYQVYTDLEDFMTQFSDAGYDIEFIWQPVGSICDESTMNGPRLVISSPSPVLNNNIISWWSTTTIDNEFIEYDVTIKIDHIYDSQYNRYGTLMWKQFYAHEECFPIIYFSVEGSFIPTSGIRKIYMYNYFTDF